ncbi:MucR family transcriptional regulator [Sphingomonas lenta]|uniref:Transcriptional regulator n=1 Tax=Sphingomonas lenta TaxID=1141887 RepID=A0A2A2SAQ4_9SPHN|nr:MucR family transcriptional regulator [Sphingomonas lenta]PAX06384.1 transcriptional regulator [Sphingomonas lenta]
MDDAVPPLASSPLELAAELTVAWLANPNTRASADEVPAFLRRMHVSVAELAGGRTGQGVPEQAEAAPVEHRPAVSARKSLSSPDHIISMIDGKPYRTLRRHLATHGLTPAEYRARYGLKPDYPMVAPSYSASRRDLAHRTGLGRKPKGGAAEGNGAPAASDPQEAATQPAKRRKLKLPEPS